MKMKMKMKKKIVAIAVVFGLVVSLFGGMKNTVTADVIVRARASLFLWEGNWNSSMDEDYTFGRYVQERYGTNLAPGTLYYPGDYVTDNNMYFYGGDIDLSTLATNRFEYTPEELLPVIGSDKVRSLQYGEVKNVPAEILANPDYQEHLATQRAQGKNIGIDGRCLELPDGYDAWKISYIGITEYDATHANCYYYFVPVKLNIGYTLTKSDEGLKWYGPNGKLIWNITESDEEVKADLTDNACLPAALVNDWSVQDKAVRVSYLYKGYTVSADIPAGELVVTDAEWYGPEYFADLNRKYITVKDWFNVEVAIDVLF